MNSSTLFLLRCFLLVLAVCPSLPLAGCSNQSDNQPPTVPAEPKTLFLGLIPEQNIFKQKERFQPLADYLAAKLGQPVKLKILPRYGNIITNFVSEKLDGAFLGSFTYALLHRKLNVQPLARPEDANGASTYHGLIFVRKDSGITSAAEMRGKRFAFVDKATTAGFLLPLHYFKEQGLADYHAWFAETYFAGTHAGSIYDVLNKKADAGAAKNTVFNRLALADKKITDALLILSRSPEVPENALVVRLDLDPVLKLRLKDALLTLHADPAGKMILTQFGAAKFIETEDQDYQPVYDYAADIGLDLTTYDYLND